MNMLVLIPIALVIEATDLFIIHEKLFDVRSGVVFTEEV
jgi:hypothetical protein